MLEDKKELHCPYLFIYISLLAKSMFQFHGFLNINILKVF